MNDSSYKPFSPEEALSHFGVKGMHWGTRKSSNTPKLNRFKRAQISANLRTEMQTLKARERASKQSEAVKHGERVAAIMLGGQTTASMAKTPITVLHQQNARIRSGKTTLLDKLQIYGATNTIDLIYPTVTKTGARKVRRGGDG